MRGSPAEAIPQRSTARPAEVSMSVHRLCFSRRHCRMPCVPPSRLLQPFMRGARALCRLGALSSHVRVSARASHWSAGSERWLRACMGSHPHSRTESRRACAGPACRVGQGLPAGRASPGRWGMQVADVGMQRGVQAQQHELCARAVSAWQTTPARTVSHPLQHPPPATACARMLTC